MSVEENIKMLFLKQREQFALISVDGPATQLHFKYFDSIISPLGTISKRYYQAIGNSIIKFRRYERSLTAWAALLKGVDEGVKQTLTVDYIEPLLHVAGNLPLTIKDQVIHATVSFAMLTVEGGSLSDLQAIPQGAWIKRFNRLAGKYPELSELKASVDGLLNSEQGKKSRNRHDNVHHDVERSLLGFTPLAVSIDNGLEVEGTEPPLDLDAEIVFIDERRRAAEKTCALFVDYVSTLDQRA